MAQSTAWGKRLTQSWEVGLGHLGRELQGPELPFELCVGEDS